VQEWTNLLQWTQSNLNSGTVVCSWWDYGYWLGILGNVTTIADNATVNATQIENVGFIMMANETQSLKMLRQYDAKYILVFITIGIQQDSNGQYFADFGSFGDEAKWFWMARISGGARTRLTDSGFMDEQSAWSNESTFGISDQSTGQWAWNDAGTNSTVYKLMSFAKDSWGQISGTPNSVSTNFGGIVPTYFKKAYFSGEDTHPLAYGGIVPIVALYEIDWAKYDSDMGITG
jgi:asparagine N-glycosylation enzyme membrane subunit Stt3